jgi:ketosteroid isomerase-like protein
MPAERRLADMAQAVSPQILDQFKDVFECWNGGDFDEMLDHYAEDGIFDVSAVFVDVAPAQGHPSIRRSFEELYESLEGLRMDPIEVLSFGSGRYVAQMRLWGRGRRSGVEVDHRYGYLLTFRLEDGKCLHGQMFPDMPSALAIAEETAVSG